MHIIILNPFKTESQGNGIIEKQPDKLLLKYTDKKSNIFLQVEIWYFLDGYCNLIDSTGERDKEI